MKLTNRLALTVAACGLASTAFAQDSVSPTGALPGDALGGPNVGDGTASDTDATPDASRISPPVLLPGYPNPVRFGFELELDAGGLDFEAIFTSLDALYLEGNRLFLSPTTGHLDRDLILSLARHHEALITIEEGAIGGFGSHVAQLLAEEGVFDRGLKFRAMVLPDTFIDQASPEDMYAVAGMNAAEIEAKVLEVLGVAMVAGLRA